MRKVTYRAVGAAPQILRAAAILPAAIAAALLWPTGNSLLIAAAPVVILVAVYLISLVPRLQVADGQLIVRGFFSAQRFDAAAVSLQLSPSYVLQYKTWNLVLVADKKALPFPWVSWMRHDLTRPWADPSPPPRALAFVSSLEEELRNPSHRAQNLQD